VIGEKPKLAELEARWRSLEKMLSPGFSRENAPKTVKKLCWAY
jgi:hypothetical protein